MWSFHPLPLKTMKKWNTSSPFTARSDVATKESNTENWIYRLSFILAAGESDLDEVWSTECNYEWSESHSSMCQSQLTHASKCKCEYTPYLAIEGRLLVPILAALGPCCFSDPDSPAPSCQALCPSIPRTIHSEPWSAMSYRTYLEEDAKGNKWFMNLNLT